MTEVYHPNSSDSADLWPQALDVGEHIHRALVDGRFQTYVWWYIRRSHCPMREDGQISKRGADMARFAKWVRPGYSRMTATGNPQSNACISAFKSGSGIVIVAINENTSPVDPVFTIRDTGSATAPTRLTSASANLDHYNDFAISGGTFNAQLTPRAVVPRLTPTAYRPRRAAVELARVFKAVASGEAASAVILVAEEVLDVMQRVNVPRGRAGSTPAGACPAPEPRP